MDLRRAVQVAQERLRLHPRPRPSASTAYDQFAAATGRPADVGADLVGKVEEGIRPRTTPQPGRHCRQRRRQRRRRRRHGRRSLRVVGVGTPVVHRPRAPSRLTSAHFLPSSRRPTRRSATLFRPPGVDGLLPRTGSSIMPRPPSPSLACRLRHSSTLGRRAARFLRRWHPSARSFGYFAVPTEEEGKGWNNNWPVSCGRSRRCVYRFAGRP